MLAKKKKTSAHLDSSLILNELVSVKPFLQSEDIWAVFDILERQAVPNLSPGTPPEPAAVPFPVTLEELLGHGAQNCQSFCQFLHFLQSSASSADVGTTRPTDRSVFLVLALPTRVWRVRPVRSLSRAITPQLRSKATSPRSARPGGGGRAEPRQGRS